MKKIVIQLEPKLPGNEKAMRERVAQLTEGIRILQNQLKLLLGSGLSLGPVPTFHCKRCGNDWQKKRFQYNKPRRCPECKSPYWDRERIYEKITRKRVQSPEIIRYLQAKEKERTMAPPPVAPMSLRERLAPLVPAIAQYIKEGMEMQQPAAETDVMASALRDDSQNDSDSLGQAVAPATDGAEPKPNESEEEIKESLADA